MESKKMKKRGMIFSMDAILGLLLLLTAITLISTIYVSEKPRDQLSYFSQDTISFLSTTNVNQLNNSYLLTLINNGSIIDNDTSVLEAIGVLWATGQEELATNLAKNITSQFFSDDYGYSFVIDDDVLFSEGASDKSEVATYKSLITGIQESKPVKGTSARIYLSDIGSHKRSDYIYFGGFVGQGNITKYTENIPSDATIKKIALELSAGDNFSLYINNIKCDDFTITTDNMTADLWDITSCNTSLIAGSRNDFKLIFDDIATAYIAGGLIRIDYYTDELFSKEVDTDTYRFPGIEGIANLYSSIFIPGTLNSMKAYIHFRSNYTTYLSIGDRVVFNITGNGSDQNITLDNSSLSSFPVSLDYDFFSNKTVPIRFAAFNTTIKKIMVGSNADVILITDLSGSMKCRMGQWACPPVGNSIPNCKPEDLVDPNSRRLGVAGCLDSQVNDMIMNESIPQGNRLWLVDFSENANPFFSNDLSEMTHTDIEQEIFDRYKSKSQHEISGGTCIACAINQAYQIFSTYSNSSRNKYLVVMTDGIPTYCTGGYWDGFNWRCDESSTGTSRLWPMWWQGTSCTGVQSDCSTNDCLGPANNAINAAQRIHDDLNVTVHAIGMGPLGTCDMANYTIAGIANAGNGSYIVTDDASELKIFYQDISQEVVDSAVLSSQTVLLKGNLTPSVLYDDSYIEYNYTTPVSPVIYGEVPLYYQSRKFNSCSESFEIPEKVRVIDAKIISYSDHHWTDFLSLENTNGTFEIFNLTKYSYDYTRLGDPFILSIPPNLIRTGDTNLFTLRTADSPDNISTCSKNNSFIYTALFNIINATIPYSSVLPEAVGCQWNIEHDDLSVMQVKVPFSYSGTKECNYTNSSHSVYGYDLNDSYDTAMYSFLTFLDFNNDGRVFVDFNNDDLVVNAKVVSDIPYLWGPTVVEVRVWK